VVERRAAGTPANQSRANDISDLTAEAIPCHRVNLSRSKQDAVVLIPRFSNSRGVTQPERLHTGKVHQDIDRVWRKNR
jgi:hypothetical protein